MFVPTVTNYYATYRGQAALIMGYRERESNVGQERLIEVLVALADGGDLVLADLADVKLDFTKLRKL